MVRKRGGSVKPGATDHCKRTPGPKPFDDRLQVHDIILENRDLVVENGKVRSRGDAVWATLKERYHLKSSAAGIHAFVVCNRGRKPGILCDLGLRKPPYKCPSDTEICSDTASVSSTPTSTESIERDTIRFDTHLSKDVWLTIAPQAKLYRRDDMQRHTREREYSVLPGGEWTHVIAAELQRTSKLSCSWSFRNHYVARSDNAQFLVKINAECNGCGATLQAVCINPVDYDPNEEGVVLNVIVKNANEDNHEELRKRAITGKTREMLGQRMVKEKLSASYVRKDLARSVSQMFEKEPSTLPNLATLRKMKSEQVAKRKYHPVPLLALITMKYTSPYRLSIQDVGADPFFVHFCTPEQMRVYNAYTQRVYSRVIIDATGSVCRKIDRPEGKSHHLFLYCAVVSIPGEHEGQIPIFQMVSERQTTNAILHWLREWIRLGGKVPNEVVVDNSPAILSALAQAFAEVQSTEEYIDVALRYMSQTSGAACPKVLIRLDIAHLTNMITSWKSVKSMKARVKEFFVRSICLAIFAQTLEEALEMVMSIMIVSKAETEGTSRSSGEDTACEVHKKKLLGLIGKEKQTMKIADDMCCAVANNADVSASVACSDNPDDPDVDDLAIPDEDNTSTNQQMTAMKTWQCDVVSRSSALVSASDDGDRDNIMQSDEFLKDFSKFCLKLPLWCHALARAMKSPYEKGIGAHVESSFNDLKSRLLQQADSTVDVFVEDFIDIVTGSMLLASGLRFFHQSVRCVLCLMKKDIPSIQSECSVCKSVVHLVEHCSIIDAEGRRLCSSCSSNGIGVGDRTSPEVTRAGRREEVQQREEESSGHHFTILQERQQLQMPWKIPVNASTTGQLTSELKCVACAAGSAPSEEGGHKCMVCGRPVHALPGCSVPADGNEEGFGRVCYCMTCYEHLCSNIGIGNGERTLTVVNRAGGRDEEQERGEDLSGFQDSMYQDQLQMRMLFEVPEDLSTAGKLTSEGISLPPVVMGVGHANLTSPAVTRASKKKTQWQRGKQRVEKDAPIFKNIQVEQPEKEVAESPPTPVTLAQDVGCAACARGDVPLEDGGHKCCRCGKPVHALPGCSVATEDGEEGFGRACHCMNCHKQLGSTPGISHPPVVMCVGPPNLTSPAVTRASKKKTRRQRGRQGVEKEASIFKNIQVEQPEKEVAESPPTPVTLAQDVGCAACARGDVPLEDGGHKCCRCGKPVHALPGCSVATEDGEEGFGRACHCMNCHKQLGSTPGISHPPVVMGVGPPNLTSPAVTRASKNKTQRQRGEQRVEKEASIFKNIQVEQPEKEVAESPPTPVTLAQDVGCAACARGDVPLEDGGHKCCRCGKPVHALPGCSVATEDGEEGFGRACHCMNCHKQLGSTSGSGGSMGKKLHQTCEGEKCLLCGIQLKSTAVKSYIQPLDGSEEGVTCLPCKKRWDMDLLENWKGLALPPKKRKDSYYQKAYPELSVLIDNSFKSKLGLLKNGGDIKLKPKKCKGITISLSNTCAFDALTQLLCTAYCDSSSYREAIDNSYVNQSPLLGFVVSIARNGVDKKTYQTRAEILHDAFPDGRKVLSPKFVAVDCTRTCKEIAKVMMLPPSFVETRSCSSSFCPGKQSGGKYVTLTADADVIFSNGIGFLGEAIALNIPSPTFECRQQFKDTPLERLQEIPSQQIYNFPNIDSSVSSFPLCAGIVSCEERQAKEHLIIQIPGNAGGSRLNTGDDVEDLYVCQLDEVPLEVCLYDKVFTLRGLTAFVAPKTRRQQSIGHFHAFCRRIGNKWELHDDLQDKIKFVKENTRVHPDLILYTI